MNGKVLFGYTAFLLIGVVIGGKVVSLAYKPVFKAQEMELYRMKDERKKITLKFEATIEALQQDLDGHNRYVSQFIEDKFKLDAALKKMGLYDQIKEWEDKITIGEE